MLEVRNDQGQHEPREIRCSRDRLVIRALAQVLQPLLCETLSPHCTHLRDHGGLHEAVRATNQHLAAQPKAQVIKSDVQSYYAHIDHLILAEQLRVLFPHEPQLHRLLSDFLRRTTLRGGQFTDITLGIPLGSSLSPLLGAVYLSPLDALAETTGGFYRRYMDDWVWIIPKRHALRRALKAQYAVLQALGVRMHPDKTFIGAVEKGIDFLGFHCCPTGVRASDAALSRRDQNIARLYEQGADHKRIARYLAAWLGWVAAVGAGVAHGFECSVLQSSGASNVGSGGGRVDCRCGARTIEYTQHIRTFFTSSGGTNRCETEIDGKAPTAVGTGSTPNGAAATDVCALAAPTSAAEIALSADSLYLFRNESEGNEFFGCTTDGDGFYDTIKIDLLACTDGYAPLDFPSPRCIPSVRVRQAVGQDDPVNTADLSTTTVNFTATFNEPVTPPPIDSVMLEGTAGSGATATVTPTSTVTDGRATTYQIAVSGLTR